MTSTQAPAVAVIPLDERPVNTSLVEEVAKIAGFECRLPPARLLPNFREPGDVEGLANWLLDQAGDIVGAVVCVDTLVYGGLIAARTTKTPVDESVARLGALRSLRDRRPDLALAAVSLVMRASDSYVSVEEPEYWPQYGRDLHALGRDAHTTWLSEQGTPDSTADTSVREDFAKRRLRNHAVNLSALQLSWDGTISKLVLTADDTAAFSAGSAEQRWLDYWRKLGGSSLPVVSYPGADETGAVLMANVLCEATGISPRVLVRAGETQSLELTPPYENGPLRLSIPRQIEACGANLVEDTQQADMILVVHGPDPQKGDHGSRNAPSSSSASVAATVAEVEAALGTDLPVVLADVRFVNGGDAPLIDALAEKGLLHQLAAYGGWNTAGNTLGGAIATGVATVIGAKRHTLDEQARQQALCRRLLDDVAYQSTIRRELMEGPFGGSYLPVDTEVLETASKVAVTRMNEHLQRWRLGGAPSVQNVRFPWDRSFEVDISFSAG